MRIPSSVRPPCLGLSSPTQPSLLLLRPIFTFSSSFPFPFKPKRTNFHFLKPCSSLKQTKKSIQKTTPSSGPKSFKRFLNLESKDDDDEDDSNGGVGDDDDGVALRGSILAGVLLVGVVGGFGTAGYVYRDQISAFLIQFSAFIEGIFLPLFGVFDYLVLGLYVFIVKFECLTSIL